MPGSGTGLGLLRNGCYVLPLGATISNCNMLSMTVSRQQWTLPIHPSTTDFWESSTIWLSTCIVEELCQVAMLLNINKPPSSTWQWPIGLLILQESQFTFLSDASHEGIGGWCPQFSLMWCITKDELSTLGYSMVILTEPLDQDPLDAIHFNVLEFVALTVNVWFALTVYRQDNLALQTQHMGNFLAINTTATISWMARVQIPSFPLSSMVFTNVAHFLSCIIPFSVASHLGDIKWYCRHTFPTFACRVMGICYHQTTSGSALLQALPHAMQSVVHIVQLHFQHRDQGNVCCKNDSTVDSQATHFAWWLGTVGYDNWSVQLIGPTKGAMLLEGYLHIITTNRHAHLSSTPSKPCKVPPYSIT